MKKFCFFLSLFLFLIDNSAYSMQSGLNHCSSTGRCVYVQVVITDPNSGYTGCGKLSTEFWLINSDKCGAYTTKETTGCGYYQITFNTWYWRVDSNYPTGIWQSLGAKSVQLKKDSSLSVSTMPTAAQAYPSGPGDCGVGACDTADDDSDGVCNACDKLPTAPDPQDCILGEAVGSDGNLSGIVIDEGCTNIQENFMYWGSDNFKSTDKWVWHIGNSAEQMGRQTCHAGGTEGNCCAYSEGSLGAQKTAGLAPAGAMPSPTVEQMVDDLTNLPAPEDLPSNCSGHNSQCEKMCQDKLGVGFSFCREDDITHETTSQCKCNTDLNYDMATPQDEKANPTEDKYDQDSNGNAVPDYADDSLLGQGDTDGDHITNKADVDSTGGPDSNKDGIDDNYQATAKAVAHAGLSMSDSTNLHDIETNTANTVASVNNLGTKIGKILDGMTAQQIKDQEYQAKIINAADSFTESNTPSVVGADETSFGGLDEHAIPVDESEDFDIDAYLAQFNYMSEMKDAIINSKVEISSADSCVDNTIHGSHVKFCFNMFEHWFLIMGQILKGLAFFRGFDIVVTGGRGFGG